MLKCSSMLGLTRMTNKDGSPLICAASHGDTDVVRISLDARARDHLTDNPPDTALRLAAAYGWPEIVDLLIAAGAEPQSIIEAAGAGDIPAWDLKTLSDFQRACALRAAAVNERLNRAIDQLLAAGRLDAEVDGHPAIFWAEKQGRSRAVAHLIDRGEET